MTEMNEVIYGKNGKPISLPQRLARRAWFGKVSKFRHIMRQVRLGDGTYDGCEMRDAKQQHEAEAGYYDGGNLISSEIDYRAGLHVAGKHTIALDIDHHVHVEPSSTEGHYHLYIDVPLEWDDYEYLLQALGDVGVLETGYVEASIRRKATDLRLPWVRKGDLPDAEQPFTQTAEGEVVETGVPWGIGTPNHPKPADDMDLPELF